MVHQLKLFNSVISFTKLAQKAQQRPTCKLVNRPHTISLRYSKYVLVNPKLVEYSNVVLLSNR